MSRLAYRYLMHVADEWEAAGIPSEPEMIRLAVEELVGERLPSGCVPVPEGAWRRVWSLVPDDVRNADSGLSGAEIVATWLEGQAGLWRGVKDATGYTFETDAQVVEAVEGLRKGFVDPYGVAHAMEGMRIDLAKALGVEGDPEAVDLVAVARDACAARDTLRQDRDRLQALREDEIASLDDICRTLGTGRSSWETVHRIVEDLTGTLRSARIMLEEAKGSLESRDAEIVRLNVELDAMAQRATMPDAVAEPIVDEDGDDHGGCEVTLESLGLPDPHVEREPANGGGRAGG